MRVKQTAKKITNDITNEIASNEKFTDIESSDHNSGDNVNDISDNEVEFLVECRRDIEGNQFLLDGTLVIEPAAVETSNEYTENNESIKEINYEQFFKEIQITVPRPAEKIGNCLIAPKKTLPSVCPNPSTFSTVKCTACNIKFNPFIGPTLFIHPLMEVILCSGCIQNQKDEYFIIDKEDNKETLCRWCVEGGSLICCDFCSKSFCKTCIKRNLGRITLSQILGQDDAVQWKCFVCDPRPIESLKAACRKVVNDIALFNDKQTSLKLCKKPISKLSDVVVGRKRSISKVIPAEGVNGHSLNPKRAAGPLPSNMANYGTEWYLKNVKLRSILTEIDEVDPRTLLNAINSTKRCVEAFYSDVRNLETEISKAKAASDIQAVVAMFKAVYRHHLFSRICQVRSRIDEDLWTKTVPVPAMATTPITGTSVINTHSVPSLTINRVVSTAPFLNKVIPRVNGCLSNGHGVVAAIDLTGGDLDRAREVVDLCADEEPPFLSLQ